MHPTKKWAKRPGLDGPVFFITGDVLYYDPAAKQWWDPTTDIYMTKEEMDYLNEITVRFLAR
jgi:hypothetical protein